MNTFQMMICFQGKKHLHIIRLTSLNELLVNLDALFIHQNPISLL